MAGGRLRHERFFRLRLQGVAADLAKNRLGLIGLGLRQADDLQPRRPIGLAAEQEQLPEDARHVVQAKSPRRCPARDDPAAFRPFAAEANRSTGHAEASTGTGATRRSESSNSCSRSGSRTGHVQRTMSTSSPNGDSLISIAMASDSTASSNGTGKRGELLQGLACPGLVGQPTANQGQVVPHGGGVGHFGRQSGQAIGRFLPLGLLQGSNGRFELRPPGGVGRARQHRRIALQQQGNLGGTIDVNQPFHGLAIFRIQRGQELEQGPAGRPMTFLDQHVGDNGGRLVDAALNIAVAQRDRPLQLAHGLPGRLPRPR